MPPKIANPSASKSLLMTLPLCVDTVISSSVNFGRAGKRLFQLFKRKCRAAGNFKNWRLAAAAEFGRIGQFWGDVERNHHGAVTIGVNEITGAHRHSGHAHFAAKTIGVDVGMRWSDRACKGLKARRPLRDVADRSVGDDTETAQRLVHRTLNLAPERAKSHIRAVDILNYVDARTRSGADIFVIGDPPFLLLGGRKAGSNDRADRGRAGITDDRRQIGERTHQLFCRVTDQTSFRRDDFQCVADRRRVIARQSLKKCSRQRRGCRIRHGGSLQNLTAAFLKALWSGYTRQKRDQQKWNPVLQGKSRRLSRDCGSKLLNRRMISSPNRSHPPGSSSAKTRFALLPEGMLWRIMRCNRTQLGDPSWPIFRG